MENFQGRKIVIVNGECVNCGEPISTGILCDKCFVQGTNEKSATPYYYRGYSFTKYQDDQEFAISDMNPYDVGYTEEYNLFEEKGQLYIASTAKYSFQSTHYKTVKIRRGKNCFEVDSRTMDDLTSLDRPEDIYSLSKCLIAKFVDRFK